MGILLALGGSLVFWMAIGVGFVCGRSFEARELARREFTHGTLCGREAFVKQDPASGACLFIFPDDAQPQHAVESQEVQ